jgi:tetratricopeptide (TPR) repeat protein
MNRLSLLLACLLGLATMPTWSAKTEPPQPHAAQAKSVAPAEATRELDANLKLQQQKLDYFDKRLDMQDKRIGDLGLYLSVFGILMTIMVIYFSFRSTREAVQAAKDEARKFIAEWLDREGRQVLLAEIDVLLKQETEKTLGQFRASATGILTELDAAKAEANRLNDEHERLIAQAASEIAANKIPSPAEQRILEDSARELEAKPPKEYQASDWMLLGIRAYQEGKFAVAAEYFGKSAETSNSPAGQAQALVNQGAALSKAGDTQGGIACCDAVEARFGKADRPALREQLAKALFNKGVILSRADDIQGAIACYDAVEARFGKTEEPALREQVAKAVNGRGFTWLCEAKKTWLAGDETAARSLLEQAQRNIDAALARQPTEPIYLGNRAYILFLLDRREEARQILIQAIALGGEELREAELADADIHRLPQDDAFVALIESLPAGDSTVIAKAG